MPKIDEVLTMDPPPARRIAGTMCFMPSHTPVWFTATIADHSSSVVSSTPLLVIVPALLKRTLIRPKRASASSTALAQSDEEVTSSLRAWPPISAATCARSSSRRSQSKSFAPSRAKNLAVVAPIPRAAPVTTATLLSNRPDIDESSSLMWLMCLLVFVGGSKRAEPPAALRGHCRRLALRVLGRGVELLTEGDRPGVGEDVFVARLDAVEDAVRRILGRALLHLVALARVGVDRPRVHAIHGHAASRQQRARGLGKRVQRRRHRAAEAAVGAGHQRYRSFNSRRIHACLLLVCWEISQFADGRR